MNNKTMPKRKRTESALDIFINRQHSLKIPRQHVQSALAFTKKRHPVASLSAAQEIIAMSDILFYEGNFLSTMASVMENKKPIILKTWEEGGRPARLVSVYGDEKIPCWFILEIGLSVLGAGYFDGMKSADKAESLFWVIQHELLHMFERLAGSDPDKKGKGRGGCAHCIPEISLVGKLKYGGNYMWGKSKK